MNLEISPKPKKSEVQNNFSEKDVVLSVENQEKPKTKKEKVDNLMEKMMAKGIEKVHMNYMLLYSGLPHDFVQGYFIGDEDYFYSADYDIKNLEAVESAIDEFNPETDQGKMFPTSPASKPFNDHDLN
jgi:hypothetical protein